MRGETAVFVCECLEYRRLQSPPRSTTISLGRTGQELSNKVWAAITSDLLDEILMSYLVWSLMLMEPRLAPSM
jgi:hypothetical protein